MWIHSWSQFLYQVERVSAANNQTNSEWFKQKIKVLKSYYLVHRLTGDAGEVSRENWKNQRDLKIMFRSILFLSFLYFWLRRVFVAVHRLSLVVVSGSYSPVVVPGLLIEVLLTELLNKSFSCRAQALGTWASLVVGYWLSCSLACGIFPGQGLTCVPCIGRQILNPRTRREVLRFILVRCICCLQWVWDTRLHSVSLRSYFRPQWSLCWHPCYCYILLSSISNSKFKVCPVGLDLCLWSSVLHLIWCLLKEAAKPRDVDC